MKKFWLVSDSDGDTCGYYGDKYETKEGAIQVASDKAAEYESTYLVLEAVVACKPERAPVSVTTL